MNSRHWGLRGVTAAALATVIGVGGATTGAAAPVDHDRRSGPVALAPADGGGWRQGDLALAPNDNRAVDRFLDRARNAEKSISPRVRAAAVMSGADLQGFDHRLKSADSLKRKVATWMRSDDGLTVNKALSEINDSVRYTLVWPSGAYASGVTEASSLLAVWGDDSVRWANTWDRKEGYKAVNAAWREPGGHRYEVQFHTPQSKAAQERTHKLYEEQRLPGTSPARVEELRAQQNQIFAAVPVPAGATALRAPVGAPAPVG